MFVDTEGLIFCARNVHPASRMDRDGVQLLLSEPVHAQLSRLRHLWLDAGYNGRNKGKDWGERVSGWKVQTGTAPHARTYSWVPKDLPPDQIDWSQYLPPPGCHVLPRRWVVERCINRLKQWRGLATRYDKRAANYRALVVIASIAIWLPS